MNNPHKNARTTPYSREQIVERYNQGQNVTDIARASGIPTRCVYNWLNRYRDEGISGLSNRPSTPRSSPHAYALGWSNLIAKLRHILTRPYTPNANGKAERFIRSAIREWAYATEFENSDQRKADLPRWQHHYNWYRPSAASA